MHADKGPDSAHSPGTVEGTVDGTAEATVEHRRLDSVAIRRAVAEGSEGAEGLYASVEVVDEVGSTNAELLRRAAEGAPDRSVLLAEHQAAGRGRLGRVWTAPPRTQVAVSVLLRPGAVSPALFGWLPLVTGMAIRDALRNVGGVNATLKWPNDVLVDGRKIAGILVEMTTVPGGGDFSVRLPAIVVGVGINVSLTNDELPVAHATSLGLAGGVTDRDALATAVLEELSRRHTQWRDCEHGSGSTISSQVIAEYSEACSTLGQEVRVDLPGNVVRTGRADRVDREGRLVVVTPDGEFSVAAGDVTHLRGVDGGLGG